MITTRMLTVGRALSAALWLLGIGCGMPDGEREVGSRDTQAKPDGQAARPELSPGVTLAASGDRGCSLFADTAVRQRMSGALELKLHQMCGTASKFPPNYKPSRGALPWSLEGRDRILPEALAAELGNDILVNDPALDSGGTTQSETTVVAVGDVVCAAWNDSGEGFGLNGFSGFGFSNDGGLTFTDGGPFPAGPSDTNFGDPSLAYSVRDETFYYAALSSVGLSMWKSTDACNSFEYVGPIHQGFLDDKELIAVDNNPESPYFGRIHVGWTDFAAGGDANVANYSDDGGVSWSEAHYFPGSGPDGQGVWPAVAPNGDVYMALVNRSYEIGGLQDQWIYRSTDGGDTWVAMTPIGSDQLQPEDPEATASCGRQALTGDVRNLSSPQIVITSDAAAAAGYVIHAVYPYDSDGAGPDHSNVFYRRSEDAGVTWSDELQINDDATTTDQFYPALGASETGVLVASWYDRRHDPDQNLLHDRYVAYSLDGGLSWSENQRMSDESAPVGQTNPHFDGLAFCYHGDYDQVSVSDNLAHVVWSDDRRVTETGPNPDVYYDQLLVNPSLGRVRASRNLVACDDTLTLTLRDADLAGTGSALVQVETSGGDSETLSLAEVLDDPGVFEVVVTTTAGSVTPGNGSLEVADSVVITVTYQDADDGTGNPAVATAEVQVDCLPPEVSEVSVEELSGTYATVVVTSSEPAALRVDYGFTCAERVFSAEGAISATPRAELEGLLSGYTYYYSVTLTDRVGNTASFDNAGECFSFTTLERTYYEDFESGDGDFTFDNGPQGGGGSGGTGGTDGAVSVVSTGNAVTTAAIVTGNSVTTTTGAAGAAGAGGEPGEEEPPTGNGLWHVSEACASQVLGHSLTHTLYYGVDATCTFDTGGLTNHGTATSPVIHLADASAAALEFNYFLGTEGGGFYDQASLEVSVDGGPFQILESNFSELFGRRFHRRREGAQPAGGAALTENTARWERVTVDLAPLLEGKTEADLVLRFRFNSIDSVANAFAGFYVDDIAILAPVAPVPCALDSECDDGLFCTGEEACLDGFCQRGLPVACGADGDDVDCTLSQCDEAAQGCVVVTSDERCDDGNFCNGFETCDATAGCQPGSPVVCAEDTVECTQAMCVEPLKGCSTLADDSLCDDGLFCTGSEFCDPSLGCQTSGPPCNDGIACTEDLCYEYGYNYGFCYASPDDSLCDDGLFCTGSEFCDSSVGCRSSGPPCTGSEACDEDAGVCEQTCFTDTNGQHAEAGRAYNRRGRFFATGSDDRLGRAVEVTSLSGGDGYFELVDSCPEAPSIDSVGVSVRGDVATISGTASDANDDIVRVEVTVLLFYYAEVSVDAVGTDEFTASLTLPPGYHVAWVEAFDSMGLSSGQSEPLYFFVEYPGAPSIDSFAVSVEGDSATLSGTAFDVNGDIDFVALALLQDGSVVDSMFAEGTEVFSGTFTDLPPGSYEARAQAFDESGLVSAPSELLPFEIGTSALCITDTNSNHVDAGRATYVVERLRYEAVGSGDPLGRVGFATRSLSGSDDYWERVASCP